jgi:hypothetical protein
MHTFDSQFITSHSVWRRLWRNLRLMLRIAKMTALYVIVGGRVRHKYRRSQAGSSVYWLDDDPALKG